MDKSLQFWIEDHELNISEYVEGSGMFSTDIGLMFVLQEKHFDGKLFNDQMALRVYDREDDESYSYSYSNTVFEIVKNYDIQYFIFEFGQMWFYCKLHSNDYKLLLYLGQCDRVTNIKGAFLGVHGIYEQMAGTGSYDEFCQKAKFLQYETLGICEKGTLAGTLPFQRACIKNEIKPILGYTFDVEIDSQVVEMKAYCKNEQGWINMLAIHHFFIDNVVDLKHIISHNQGLVFTVSDSFMLLSEDYRKKMLKKLNLYYQLTLNEYKDPSRDLDRLNNHKAYLDQYWEGSSDKYHKMPCVIINDAYCLELEDVHLKKMLSDSIGKHALETVNHYMRSIDEQFYELEELFKDDDDRLFDVFSHAMKNTIAISESCNYQIDTSSFHLPKYKLTDDELQEFGDEENPQLALFQFIIEDALHAGKKINADKYSTQQIQERLDKEIEVIKKGGFIDYFLILWDIINYCEQNNILTGVGRGSAGGSLVAYLMGIIKLNPLDYDLLFERFLNEGRAGRIEQKKVVVVETDNGDIEFDFDQKVRILRSNKEMHVEANQIEDGDVIKEN